MCQDNFHREVVFCEKAPKAVGPYSQAICSGGFVFVSGQISAHPETGEIISRDIKTQTKRVLENLKNILEEAGSNINRVVKTTVFIKNMSEYSEVNEVYAEYFSDNPPARSCVEVSRLPKDVLVEIEAIAIIEE